MNKVIMDDQLREALLKDLEEHPWLWLGVIFWKAPVALLTGLLVHACELNWRFWYCLPWFKSKEKNDGEAEKKV